MDFPLMKVPSARLGDTEVSEAVQLAVDHIFAQGFMSQNILIRCFFGKSTPPQDRQLIVLIYELKR